MLTREEIIKILEDTGALLRGHFLLSSGLHSDSYIQCAKVLQYPDLTEKLCRNLGEKLKKYEPEIVVGPALGGVVVSYELARALKVPGIFTERKDGKMLLRRGFKVESGQKVVVVEDVVTTGGSAKEVIEVIKNEGAEVVAVASLIDRSGGTVDFGVPFEPLLSLKVPTYTPEECPLCKNGSEAIKPGSRS